MKLLMIFILFLCACSGMKVEDFKNENPKFVFEEFFLGEVKGTGVFFDRFSNLKRRFTVSLIGTMNGKDLILDEVLLYSDGEKATRKYVVKKISDNHYEATADGVVGKAIIESSGNAVRWKYDLEQKIGDSIWVLNFDDWMFLENPNLVLNRAKAYKFGLFVGEIFMSIEKQK